MIKKFSGSAAALIAANLVPLFGVLYLGWETIDILFIYWFESLIIGFFNLVKMLFTDMYDRPKCPAWKKIVGNILLLPIKLLGVIFFTVHYGGFMLGHGIFLLVLFARVPETLLENPVKLVPFIIDLFLKMRIAIFSLFISHGISFIKNNRDSDYLFNPYRRIIIMHLTIILAAGVTIATGQNIFALIGLITTKTIADLWAHIKERRRVA